MFLDSYTCITDLNLGLAKPRMLHRYNSARLRQNFRQLILSKSKEKVVDTPQEEEKIYFYCPSKKNTHDHQLL